MDAPSSQPEFGLLGDLGGTNARFALVALGDDPTPRLIHPRNLRAADYVTAEAAALAYLSEVGRPARLRHAMVACAGPVEAGQVSLTNLSWTVSCGGLETSLGLQRACLINDLEAVAWSTPALGPQDVHVLGGIRTGAVGGTLAVVGAGTGFNASACLRATGGDQVMVGEAGHASLAAVDELEMEVVRRLALRFGRVSIERAISGPGILNLYQTLSDIRRTPAVCPSSEDVSRLAREGDPCARDAIEMFCGLLGSIAGDLALSYGARGGVFIAGGIAPTLLKELAASAFRRRFEAKGRFRSFMETIPTRVITHPHAALVGAARALEHGRIGLNQSRP